MAKTTVPITSFKAAIFDMDGTMIANTAYHQKAWQEFLKRHDIALSEDEFQQKISGKKNDQILNQIFDTELSDQQIADYADEKEAIYRELYSNAITEVTGLSHFIDTLHQYKIKTAVATTAPEKNRTFALQSLGLSNKFEVIRGDEHTTQGKPHPEIYLLTAKDLGIEPSECIAFEDSPPGLQSAKAAGMQVVAIMTYHTKDELREADYWVKDFSEIHF